MLGLMQLLDIKAKDNKYLVFLKIDLPGLS